MKKFLSLILALCTFSRLAYGDISWDSPLAISTALTDASNPQVVIDASNNATAVWIENNTIMASSLPSGGSWSSPTAISNPLNTSSDPRLGIDDSGNVTAIWIESNVITSATLPSGGSWSSSTAVSGSGAITPALVVDSTDRAVAIWARSGFIESSTRTSGTWSLVSTLSAASSSNPDIATSSFGTAIAAWKTITGGTTDVIVTNILTLATNTWGTNKNVFNGVAAVHHNFPKVALDANGNALLVWWRYNVVDTNSFQNVQVVPASLTLNASAWALSGFLSNPGIRDPADLVLTLNIDSGGNALAVWTNSFDGETFSLESDRKLFGLAWPEFVEPQVPSLYTLGLDVAMVTETALLTNMAWDGVSSLQIQSQESSTANPSVQAWSDPNIFSTGDENGYPKCDVSISGATLNAVAVWIHNDGVNNVIHASSGSGTVIDPPSNVAATQSSTDYGVYVDFFNTITWDASSDPDVVQYNLYRNGVYFAQTDSSTFSFVDNNQGDSERVTYGVAAITSAFKQSAIVSFTLFP